jgi:hypothetical protein
MALRQDWEKIGRGSRPRPAAARSAHGAERRMRTGTFTVVLRLFRFASPVTPQLCAEQQRRAIGFTKPEERHQCHRRSRHHEECGRYFVAGAFHEPGCHQR